MQKCAIQHAPDGKIDTQALIAMARAWEGLEAQRADGGGNVSVDPLYCDPGAGDLRLQEGTPVPTFGALGVGCE